MVISPKSLLNGRYIIQSVLGNVGPYDVSYLANDLVASQEVVVREYFPLNLAYRANDGFNLEVYDSEAFSFGLAVYGREAELLSETSLPNILGVSDTFQENGTLYRVSKHTAGVPLSAFMRHEGKDLTEEQIVSMMIPLLDGLASAHAQYLFHGYINPKSIFITDEFQPVFLNFQMARTRLAQRCNDQLEPLAFSPYFNIEDADFANWDIYSFGATLYYMLSGKSLPIATNSAEHIYVEQTVKHDHDISPSLKKFLLETLSVDAIDHSKDITQLKRRLLESYSQTVYLNSDALNVDIGPPPATIAPGYQTGQSGEPLTNLYVTHNTTKHDTAKPDTIRATSVKQLPAPEGEISMNDRFIHVINRQQYMILAMGMVLLVSLVVMFAVFMGRRQADPGFANNQITTLQTVSPAAAEAQQRRTILPGTIANDSVGNHANLTSPSTTQPAEEKHPLEILFGKKKEADVPADTLKIVSAK